MGVGNLEHRGLLVILAFVYNLDKKTLEKMNKELAERHAGEQ